MSILIAHKNAPKEVPNIKLIFIVASLMLRFIHLGMGFPKPNIPCYLDFSHSCIRREEENFSQSTRQLTKSIPWLLWKILKPTQTGHPITIDVVGLNNRSHWREHTKLPCSMRWAPLWLSTFLTIAGGSLHFSSDKICLQLAQMRIALLLPSKLKQTIFFLGPISPSENSADLFIGSSEASLQSSHSSPPHNAWVGFSKKPPYNLINLLSRCVAFIYSSTSFSTCFQVSQGLSNAKPWCILNNPI